MDGGVNLQWKKKFGHKAEDQIDESLHHKIHIQCVCLHFVLQCSFNTVDTCSTHVLEWSGFAHFQWAILTNIHEGRSLRSPRLKLRLRRVLTYWHLWIRQATEDGVAQKWQQFKNGNRVHCREVAASVYISTQWKACNECGEITSEGRQWSTA